MLNRIKTEPVLVTGLIRATILCLSAFGLSLSTAQVAAVMLLTEAVLSLFTRAKVTPTDTEPNEDGAVSLEFIVGILVGLAIALLLPPLFR